MEGVGWRTTFVLIGAGTVALAALAAALVRDRPAALGLPPVNPESAVGPVPGLGEMLRGIGGVVGNPRTWPPILVAGGMYMRLITFMGLWGIPYLVHVHGLGRVEAASVVALAPLGLCVGSPVVGWLSDRWLRRQWLSDVILDAPLGRARDGRRPCLPAGGLSCRLRSLPRDRRWRTPGLVVRDRDPLPERVGDRLNPGPSVSTLHRPVSA